MSLCVLQAHDRFRQIMTIHHTVSSLFLMLFFNVVESWVFNNFCEKYMSYQKQGVYHDFKLQALRLRHLLHHVHVTSKVR